MDYWNIIGIINFNHIQSSVMAVKNRFQISENNEQNMMRLRNADVAVLGAARSGIAATRLLYRSGSNVLLSDTKPLESLNAQAIKSLPAEIEIELGMHSRKILDCDLICISPGIPLRIPILQEAQQMNIPIVGELEIASWFTGAPIIAITGSSGKTTTTSLTGSIFKKYFQRLIVGGNIGNPIAAQILVQPNPEICVLEVSSFQLETIANFRPQIAVIMNLSPNHLDRYPDFDEYAAAKMNILKNLNRNDILIYNIDEALLTDRIADFPAEKIPFSNQRELEYGAYWNDDQIRIHLNDEYWISLSNYTLKGPHNRYNMVVAALLAVMNGIPEEVIRNELENFPGIPHRLEEVRTVNGITFVNDSKATTVSSLQYALQSFEEPIVLIAGGIDKGGDFCELNDLLKKKVRATVLIGKASQRMNDAWNVIVPVHAAQTLEDAVYAASDLAKKGDVVLLSPACSSFDMFNDYEDRGNQYKQIVTNLSKRENLKIKFS